jgi:hypothetical protein
MSDQTARTSFLAILNDSVLNQMNYGIDGMAINSGLLARVRSGVTAGQISVRHVPGLVSSGIYNSTENRFYFRRDTFSTIPAQALAVHEACHAGCDIARASMRTVGSEVAAYIAQCVYARSKSSDPANERLYDDNPRKDRVFEVDWEIAGRILSRNPPTDSQLQQMRTAVANHPEYASTAQNSAGFNGVPGM